MTNQYINKHKFLFNGVKQCAIIFVLHSRLLIVAFVVAIILWPQPVQAAVNCSNPALVCKSGILSSDEVWTADKVYVVYSNVTVPAVVTLTIERIRHSSEIQPIRPSDDTGNTDYQRCFR